VDHARAWPPAVLPDAAAGDLQHLRRFNVDPVVARASGSASARARSATNCGTAEATHDTARHESAAATAPTARFW